MCAQFQIKAKIKELERVFGVKISKQEQTEINERIVPFKQSPVMTSKGIRSMQFSLIPSWSKDKKPKFSTHNARVETVGEKPLWRGPIKSKRCLIPLTTFIEPIYKNKLAGNMVGFKTPEEEILVAAGIYDEWMDKETGEVLESYSIITTEALAFVAKQGHDRSPYFIKEEGFKNWLSPEINKLEEALEILEKNKLKPELMAEVDRPMKPGWQKRAGLE